MKKLIHASVFILFSLLLLIDFGLQGILLGVLLLGICYFISYRLKIKNFTLTLISISLLLRFIVICVIKTPLFSDFEVLYNASKQLANGDTSFQFTQYFELWGYQTGFVMYQAFILRIFHSMFALKVMNVLITTGTCYLIYKIAKQFSSEKSARFVSLLYCVFPFSFTLTSVLTNQHLSTFLFLFGTFLFLKETKHNTIKYILIGLLFSFGNFIRPEGIIVITTILIYSIIQFTRKNWKKILKPICIIIVTYLICNFCLSNLVIQTKINQNGLTNQDPLWKFVLGFDKKTNGMYDESRTYLLGNKEEEQKIIINDLFENPFGTFKLFVNKARIFWLRTDLSWSLGYQSHHISYSILQKSNELIYGIILILLLISITRKKENKVTFFVIQILITFGVYLLIEVMPRYAYYIQTSLFIISPIALDYLYNQFHRKEE